MGQRLAYCGLGVAKVEEFMQFAVKAMGLMADDLNGLSRLRMDARAWRIAIHPFPVDDILYAGVEFDSQSELMACRSRLESLGVECTTLRDDDCLTRQVESGFTLTDPDGLRVEMVFGHADSTTPFQSDLVSGFKTNDQGLGHIVLAIDDLDQGIEFYEHLGFRLSDFITIPVGGDHKLRIAFMHCNARHHSLAMACLPGGKRLNHVMIEVSDVDAVVQGHRRCVEAGYKPGNIGRHSNDQMFSFYTSTPGGFDFEYGWDGREITGDWQVAEYDSISTWGHERA